MTQAPTATRVGAARRQLGLIVAVIVVAAGVTLLVGSLRWLTVDATRPAPFTPVHHDVSGHGAYPGLSGLAVVALLVAVLSLVTGRLGRRVLGALLVLAGGWSAYFAVRAMSVPDRARLVGLLPDSSTASYLQVSGHPVRAAAAVVLVASAVLAAAGVALAVRAGNFSSGLSERYSAPAEARRVGDPWRSLDRGEDPTVSDG